MERGSTGSRSAPLHVAALLGVICLLAGSACAETVEASLPGGTMAEAEFHSGQQGKPAVLLLHGFLQTRQAPPVSRLTASLADRGYTVLAPTLTLGIGRRAQSLACEAVHAHTIDQDIAEIDFWIKWLAAKGYDRIAVVGHSLGSMQLLQYLAHTPHPAVKRALLSSLIPVRSDRYSERPYRSDDKQALSRFTLSFCHKNYVAPRHAFLTYARNGRAAAILRQMGKVRVPVEVILGDADKTMERSWPGALRKSGATVKLIPKAGHFFDGAQEFDLADAIEAGLKLSAAK